MNILSETDASRYLRLSKPTLRRMRAQGTGPAFHRLGEKSIRYTQTGLDEFIEQSKVEV